MNGKIYNSSKPLERLEKGDKAIIKVNKPCDKFISEKDMKKYANVPNGYYEAICIGYLKLECKEHPILSGRYNLWLGDKWGTTCGIHANEIK